MSNFNEISNWITLEVEFWNFQKCHYNLLFIEVERRKGEIDKVDAVSLQGNQSHCNYGACLSRLLKDLALKSRSSRNKSDKISS